MHDFLMPNEAAFADLRRRATGRCVRFRQQQMPPGANPSRADIGFEVDEASGEVQLLVQHGVAWRGNQVEVQDWLAQGARRFDSFDDLVAWLHGPLADCFDSSGHRLPAAPPRQAVGHRPMPVTDELATRGLIDAHRRELAPVDGQALYQGLAARVIGQEPALRSLASLVVRHLAREEPQRPAVAFMVGPTGVGKTLSAEVLASLLTAASPGDRPWRYLRIDMSEYAEAHRVSQLLGSPQGYVGHGERSELVDALASGDPGVLLLDEIDKAHPKVFKMWMNAMDAGRLSSAAALPDGSRQLDCRRWIILFTSNQSAEAILRDLPSDDAGDPTRATAVCRRHLRQGGVAAELLGRIPRFLVFRPIAAEHRVALMLGLIGEVAAEYGVSVGEVSPARMAALLQASQSDRAYGGRGERATVDELLGDQLAQARRRGQAHIDCLE